MEIGKCIHRSCEIILATMKVYIMSDETLDDDQVFFENVKELAHYLDIGERRLRQYKQSGRLNYSTSAVLVDRTELTKLKQRIVAWGMTPYIPHRFRSRGGERKSYRRHRQKSVGGGNPDLKNRSSNRQDSRTAEAQYNQLLNRAEERIEDLMRSYGLSREEALEVLKNDERR